MKSQFYQLRPKKERGQGFAEYALLLVFVAISTILVMAALNAVISGQFENVAKCIHNNGSRALTSSTCEVAEASSASGSTTSSASGSASSSASGSASGSSSGGGPTDPVANFTFICTN